MVIASGLRNHNPHSQVRFDCDYDRDTDGSKTVVIRSTNKNVPRGNSS